MKNLVRIIVLILVMVAVGGARAQQLNEQEAKARAMRYLTNHGKAFVRGENPSGKELALTSATVEARSIYAFNREGGGYVIASADSRALPVLGYSDTGTIDWEQMGAPLPQNAPQGKRHRPSNADPLPSAHRRIRLAFRCLGRWRA